MATPGTRWPDDMLKQRILTAIVAVIALSVVLFVVPEPVARAVIAALLLSGAWEWGGLIGDGGTATRVGFTAVVAASMVAIFMFLSNPQVLDVVLQTALIWWLAALLWMFFFPTPIPVPLVWICGLLVLVPAWAALDYLYRLDAQLLQHVLEGLHRKWRLAGLVTTSVKTYNQSVADQLVSTHTRHISQVFDPLSCRLNRQAEQSQCKNREQKLFHINTL